MTHPLAYDTWGAEERAAILAVLDSGRFTMGVKVREFEAAFARYMGMAHAVMVNSGSSANLLAVAALVQAGRLQPGDEVIVPAIAWATTYAPLAQYGLRLRVVDVDLDTLNVSLPAVEAAINERTRAIVAVSILGNPASLPELWAIAYRHGLVLMEDNCESLGASVGGRLAGAWGDITTHSFFFSHQLSTGEGGMVTTNDRRLADLARSMRAHGWTRDLADDSPIYQRTGDDFDEGYKFILPGYNLRPTEIAAAVGLVQLRGLDAALDVRRRNARIFQTAFGNDQRFIIQRENGKGSWFGFTIITAERARLFPAMREAGIEFRQITGGNFWAHPVARQYDVMPGEAPNAQFAHERGFFVGNASRDLSDEIGRLREVLDRAAA